MSILDRVDTRRVECGMELQPTGEPPLTLAVRDQAPPDRVGEIQLELEAQAVGHAGDA
jgi:hypothetical protein